MNIIFFLYSHRWNHQSENNNKEKRKKNSNEKNVIKLNSINCNLCSSSDQVKGLQIKCSHINIYFIIKLLLLLLLSFCPFPSHSVSITVHQTSLMVRSISNKNFFYFVLILSIFRLSLFMDKTIANLFSISIYLFFIQMNDFIAFDSSEIIEPIQLHLTRESTEQKSSLKLT